MSSKYLESDVWGPYIWFFLHTCAFTYPTIPTSILKKKYYEFIHNVPIFLPNPEMGKKFESILNRFPLTPYLDNRDSFMRWVHKIHNYYNIILGKPKIEYQESLDEYQNIYRNHRWNSKYAHYTNIHTLSVKTIVYCCILLLFILAVSGNK